MWFPISHVWERLRREGFACHAHMLKCTMQPKKTWPRGNIQPTKSVWTEAECPCLHICLYWFGKRPFKVFEFSLASLHACERLKDVCVLLRGWHFICSFPQGWVNSQPWRLLKDLWTSFPQTSTPLEDLNKYLLTKPKVTNPFQHRRWCVRRAEHAGYALCHECSFALPGGTKCQRGRRRFVERFFNISMWTCGKPIRNYGSLPHLARKESPKI